MGKLWSLLTNELGQGFRSQFGDEGGESFRYWTQQLSQFTEQQIFKGVERWVYSNERFINVKILRSLCQPKAEDYGLPSIEHAHPLICQRQWEKLHPAFQHVARSYDLFSIRQMSSESSLRAIKPLYAEVVERVARGEEFERIQTINHNPSGTSHMGSAEARARNHNAKLQFKSMLSQLKMENRTA